MSEVVNSLLGEGLRRRMSREVDQGFELPSYHMGLARVNLGDRNALEVLMAS